MQDFFKRVVTGENINLIYLQSRNFETGVMILSGVLYFARKLKESGYIHRLKHLIEKKDFST